MSFERRAVAPLVGIVIAAALGWQGRGLGEIAREGDLGPGFWPRLVLIGLALACAAKVVEEWRRRHGSASPAPDADVDRAASEYPDLSRWRLASGMLLIVLYVFLASWIGFSFVTAAFIVAFMWLGGARSVSGILANAVIGTVGLLYLFIKLVYLPLPKGVGAFESITLTLYRALGIL